MSAERLRLDILVPVYRLFNAQSHAAVQRMVQHTAREVDVFCPPHVASGVIHWTRNNMLKEIRREADYVLLMDDDMLPEPDAALRLLAHQVPVVSALTTTRGHPVKLTVKVYDRPGDRFVEVDAVKPDTLLSGDFGVGAGFLLVQNRVIKQLREHWLTARDWLAHNAGLFDRLKVDPELLETERRRREIARRGKFKRSNGTTRIFEFLEAEDGEENGEDVGFCRKCLHLGIPISCDTGVQVGHVGDFPFGPWNLGVTKASDEQWEPE